MSEDGATSGSSPAALRSPDERRFIFATVTSRVQSAVGAPSSRNAIASFKPIFHRLEPTATRGRKPLMTARVVVEPLEGSRVLSNFMPSPRAPLAAGLTARLNDVQRRISTKRSALLLSF